MNTNVAPIEDLRWLFSESDAAIGYRSIQGGIQAQLEQSAMPPGSPFRGSRPTDPADVERMVCASGSCRVVEIDELAAALLPGWISSRVPTVQERHAAGRLRVVHRALSQLSPLHQAVIGHAYTPRNINGEAGGPKLERDYGVAAGAVRHVLAYYRVAVAKAAEESRQARDAAKEALRAGTGVGDASRRKSEASRANEAVRQAAARAPRATVQALRDAHAAYKAAKREVQDDLREQRQAARVRGEHRRKVLLDEMLGTTRKEAIATRARAWMVEMGIEVEA